MTRHDANFVDYNNERELQYKFNYYSQTPKISFLQDKVVVYQEHKYQVYRLGPVILVIQ